MTDITEQKDLSVANAVPSSSANPIQSNQKEKTSRAITLSRLEQVLDCPNLTKDLS